MVYKQKDLVKMVAKESGYYQGAVKDIYDATFDVITQLLSESAPDNLATIKLFEGLNINAKFIWSVCHTNHHSCLFSLNILSVDSS